MAINGAACCSRDYNLTLGSLQYLCLPVFRTNGTVFLPSPGLALTHLESVPDSGGRLYLSVRSPLQ